MSCLKSVREIEHFHHVLSENKTVRFNSRGKWRVLKGWQGKLYRLFFSKTRMLISFNRHLSLALDNYEKTPFSFNTKSIFEESRVAAYLKVGKLLETKMQEKNRKSKSSKKLIASQELVQKKLIALEYRAEKINGGSDPLLGEIDKEAELIASAEKWYQSKKPSTYNRQDGELVTPPTLSSAQKDILKKALEYPHFIELLFRSPSTKNEFFKWVLVNKCPVEAFIEFPGMCKKLSTSFIHKRISAFSPDVLKVKKCKDPTSIDEGRVKALTLPFQVDGGQVKKVNILNESETIKFTKSRSMTVDQVFKEFKEKKAKSGPLEMMEGQIAFWDTNKLSASGPEWYKELKPYQKLTLAEMQEKYPWLDLESGQDLAIVRGSRVNENLDFNQTHAVLEMAIADSDGNYQLYPFGKIAKKYPQKPIEKLGYLAGTYHSTIMYPDENVYYTHRQSAFYPIKITPEEKKQIFELIGKDIESSNANNEVFQLAYRNCADWVQGTLEKVLGKQEEGGKLPNLFRMPIINSTPARPANHIFAAMRKSPKVVKKGAFYVLDVILGSWRGVYTKKGNKKRYECLLRSGFRKTRQTSHSALLFEKIIMKEIQGTIV